jgi:hypothetical protein
METGIPFPQRKPRKITLFFSLESCHCKGVLPHIWEEAMLHREAKKNLNKQPVLASWNLRGRIFKDCQ